MPTVISFHTRHDANVSIAVDGQLKVVLELERLFDVRYFDSDPKKDIFREQWKKAVEVVTKQAGISRFDIGITSWALPSIKNILQELVHAEKWVTVDHHRAHASIAFYDSPFNKGLVFSYDGGGNDGLFNIFLGDRATGLKHIKWVRLNLGQSYRQLAMLMPEISKKLLDPACVNHHEFKSPLALSGKVMGYAALGEVRPEWVPALRQYYLEYIEPEICIFSLGQRTGLALEYNSLDEKTSRDLAATSQTLDGITCTIRAKSSDRLAWHKLVFSQVLVEKIKEHWTLIKEEDCDGILLSGGCALNVHANQVIVEKFGLPVHVAPAPNDCGISVGAIWAIDPPTQPQHIQYKGLPCWDLASLPELVLARKAKQVTAKEVADLLLGGAVVALVRGRQEYGPRALGHRSILCYPNKEELKDKINKLKSREWFRPLCPSVAIESVPKLFSRSSAPNTNYGKPYASHVKPHCEVSCIDCSENGEKFTTWVPASPYMSFAPPMKPEARTMFPAICHYDGTARLQTVRKEDDAWYHRLLTEVAAQNGGYGILLNTSFNVKGKPILNELKTALEILDTSPEGTFDYVVLEDWLFKAERKETA